MAIDTKILKISKEFDEIKQRIDSLKDKKQQLQDQLTAVNQGIADMQAALDSSRQSLKDAVNE